MTPALGPAAPIVKTVVIVGGVAGGPSGAVGGARTYTASRLLIQRGFDASPLSGGAQTWFCVEKDN